MTRYQSYFIVSLSHCICINCLYTGIVSGTTNSIKYNSAVLFIICMSISTHRINNPLPYCFQKHHTSSCHFRKRLSRRKQLTTCFSSVLLVTQSLIWKPPQSIFYFRTKLSTTMTLMPAKTVWSTKIKLLQESICNMECLKQSPLAKT